MLNYSLEKEQTQEADDHRLKYLAGNNANEGRELFICSAGDRTRSTSLELRKRKSKLGISSKASHTESFLPRALDFGVQCQVPGTDA
jgi:hypothetical protein